MTLAGQTKGRISHMNHLKTFGDLQIIMKRKLMMYFVIQEPPDNIFAIFPALCFGQPRGGLYLSVSYFSAFCFWQACYYLLKLKRFCTNVLYLSLF